MKRNGKILPFTTMLEGNNSNFEAAEQRIYADDERISLSLLKRLEKKLDDMTTVFQQMVPKLAEFESKILKLELAVNELSSSMKSNTVHDSHHHNQSRFLNLQFSDKISCPVRTGEEIKGLGGNYLRVTLVNETGELVDSGPESSAEVHIFALKGDVDDENEGHSSEKNIKKAAVLVGDVQLKLNKGIGILANIKFRSSSSHVSGMFKIGARVVVDSFQGSGDGVVIRDAKTATFRVKDYRGKYNEKHRPPSLLDEVWRLDNIGKGGSIHNRLENHKFHTVEDFLIQLLKDSDGLKQLVDLPPKKWEATVKHALTCRPDEKVYGSVHSEEKSGIVFNEIGKVSGLIHENKYFPLEKISHEAKVHTVATNVHNEASLVQHFVGPAEPLQHPSQLITMSENAVDYHEEEASGTVENAMDYHGLPNCRSFSGMYEFDMESLFAACDVDQNTTTSFSDMLFESPVAVVSDNEVKKKLFFFFTITKWLLNYEKIVATAACSDRNDNQKRRRIA